MDASGSKRSTPRQQTPGRCTCQPPHAAQHPSSPAALHTPAPCPAPDTAATAEAWRPISLSASPSLPRLQKDALRSTRPAAAACSSAGSLRLRLWERLARKDSRLQGACLGHFSGSKAEVGCAEASIRLQQLLWRGAARTQAATQVQKRRHYCSTSNRQGPTCAGTGGRRAR